MEKAKLRAKGRCRVLAIRRASAGREEMREAGKVEKGVGDGDGEERRRRARVCQRVSERGREEGGKGE